MKRVAWTWVLSSVATVTCGYAQDNPKLDVSFQEKRLAVIPENVRLDRNAVAFSPDGRMAAAAVFRDGKEFILLGENKGAEFDKVSQLRFCPDGKTVVYMASQGRKKLIVIGEKKGELFDRVSRAIIGSDNRAVAYVGENRDDSSGRKKAYLIVGERKSEEYYRVTDFTVGPDGKTIAYSAIKDRNCFVVVGEAQRILLGRLGLTLPRRLGEPRWMDVLEPKM